MDTKQYNVEDEEIEIDLKVLFLQAKSLWYVLLIGALIGMLVAVLYTTFLKTPMYQSSSKVYLRNASQTVSLSDLQVSQELTSDYEIIFKSRPVLENVIENLNLDYTYETLNSMISITNPSESHILMITVTSDDPELSKLIANETMHCSVDTVREIDSQEPYIVESAVASKQRIGNSITKTGIMGGIVGFAVVLMAIVVKVLLSDTIQSIEDVENTLHLPVLAVVAEDKTLAYNKASGKRRKRGDTHG